MNTYQHMIGILRWEYELVRMYILTEVSVLYQHLCNPREGHLDAVFQIFKYLNVNIKCISVKLVFDYLEQLIYIFPIKGLST